STRPSSRAVVPPGRRRKSRRAVMAGSMSSASPRRISAAISTSSPGPDRVPTADLSLNLATVRKQWSMREAVEAAARHGFAGVAPWRDMVADAGTAQAARLFRDSGLRVTGYCRAGLFPAADAAGRQAAIDDNKRAIDEAAAIGAECVVMIGGGLPQGSRDIVGARQMFI